MSSIELNKPKPMRKKNIGISEGKGVKNDVSILRIVAQSKGCSLPFAELRRKTKTNSIYAVLDRLSPTTNEIPGRHLFCYDDLIKDHESDEAKEKETEKLREKLKESYEHFLQWQNWPSSPRFRVGRKNANKTLSIQLDKNNLILLKLIPDARQDADKAILKFRKKKFDYIDDSKYTRADITLLNYSRFGGMNNDGFSFKTRKDYLTGRIPLIPERKGGKLYFRTLSENSYYFDKFYRTYLGSKITGKGLELIDSHIKSKITRKRGESHKHQISRVLNKRCYQEFSIEIRGLLLYALIEQDNKEFNKSIENLTEQDTYDEPVTNTIETMNEFGEPGLPVYNLRYKIKRNFPFLTHYKSLKEILPEYFAIRQIKEIAMKLRNRLETDSLEDLKYDLYKVIF